MRERIAQLLASVRAWWGRLTKRTKIVILATTAGILVLTLALVLYLNRVNYVLLYPGLSARESADAIAVLGEMGITPRVTDYGAIYIPEQDADRARVQIAMRGYTGGGFTYDIYAGGAGLTSTQADRDQWYIYQTQNRIQEMLQTLPEIELAVVNISKPQASLYTLGTDTLPPSAAVTLTLYQGAHLSAEQIQGIINTVKNSVSGLTEDNISISDTTGDLKMQLKDSLNSSSAKLALTEQYNRIVSARLMSMLVPAYGEGNVLVSVSAMLDTDSSVKQSNEYVPFDPDDPRNNPVDYSTRDWEKIGGDAGVVEGVPGANDNVDVPEYAAEDVDLADADSYAVRSVDDYLVSSIREEIVKEGFDVTGLSVAVLINSSNLTDARRDQTIDLCASAAGTTIEMVSVHAMPFATSEPVDFEYTQPDNLTNVLIITGIGLLALAIMFTIILLSMRKKQREAAELAAMEAAGEDPYGRGSTLAEMMNREEEEFEPIQLAETQEQKLKVQIRDLAESDPEIVAMLLKTWLSVD